jgi:hypothetical protein
VVPIAGNIASQMRMDAMLVNAQPATSQSFPDQAAEASIGSARRPSTTAFFGDRMNASDVIDDGSSQPLQAHEDLVIELLDEMGAGAYRSI